MTDPKVTSHDEYLDVDRRFQLVTLGGGLLFAGLCLFLRFGDGIGQDRLPRRPPPPPPADRQSLVRTDYNPEIYAAYLAADSEAYGAARASVADLSGVLPRSVWTESKLLSAGEAPIETQDLRISLKVEEREATAPNGTYMTPQVSLVIENKTPGFLAYRVDTTPEASASRCSAKAVVWHNALALGPREVLSRTECLYKKGMRVRVDRIETIAIPELSYYYLSRLTPTHIGLDVRATQGHRPPVGQPCGNIPEQAIRKAIQEGKATWFDVVDFYARHRCDTYLFKVGYRAFTRPNEIPLPFGG